MLHMQEGEGAKIGVGQSDERASHPFFGMVMMIGMMMIIKIAIYCPQGSGTLRQQLLMMHGIAWYCRVLHCIA